MSSPSSSNASEPQLTTRRSPTASSVAAVKSPVTSVPSARDNNDSATASKIETSVAHSTTKVNSVDSSSHHHAVVVDREAHYGSTVCAPASNAATTADSDTIPPTSEKNPKGSPAITEEDTTTASSSRANNNNNNTIKPSPEATPSSTWYPVEETDLMQPSEHTRLAHQAFARKLHRVFSVTAAPTAALLGLFFLLLFFKANIEAHTVGRVVAAFCVAMAFLMTALMIFLHLSAFTDEQQQKRIIRILAMVPIYALSSLLALWRHDIAPIVGLLRDGYESIVIYSFYNLLMGYLGGEEMAFADRPRASVTCLAPFCCFSFNLTRKTFRTWKFLLAQYMILKPTLSLIAVLLLVNGKYDEDSWSPSNAHLWFVFILNISVTLAFTALVYLFVEYKEKLKSHKPGGKFLAVKAVVFLTFWQSVALGILVHLGYIQGSKEGLWTPSEVSTGIQDFLICIEMLLMSYLHEHVFPETQYIPVTGYHDVDCASILKVINLADLPREAGSALSDVAPDVLPDFQLTKKH